MACSADGELAPIAPVPPVIALEGMYTGLVTELVKCVYTQHTEPSEARVALLAPPSMPLTRCWAFQGQQVECHRQALSTEPGDSPTALSLELPRK